MIYLIKRELKKDGRDMLAGILAIMCPLMILLLLYVLLKEQAQILGGYMFGLPVEVYRLFGFPINPGEYNMQFYGKIFLMIANIIIIISFCYKVCDTVERDEYDGTIFFMCNQLYNRREIILGKFIGTLIEYIIQYSAMIIMISVAEYVADVETIAVGRLLTESAGLLFGGICIGVLYISVAYAFCVYDRKKDELELSLFTGLITFGLLIIGNIHRILMVVALLISKTNADAADKFRSMSRLKIFRNISPLSQLNPNNHYTFGMWIKVGGISLVLSAVFIGLTIFLYERRHIERN